MNTLQLTKLSVTLLFVRDSNIPLFIGNAIRGALGHALFGEYCKHKNPVCENCSHISDCAYGSVFKVIGTVSTPNPYCISAPYPSNKIYKAGDKLTFYITLFGQACGFEGEIISVLSAMCAGKFIDAEVIGVERIYSSEWSDFGSDTLEHCDTLTINFLSPTVINSSGKILEKPTFSEFVDSLFVRVSGIIDNYSDNEFMLPYGLFARKPFISATYKLRTVRLQTSGQPTDGIVGSVIFSGEVTRYLPYIDLGSQLQIGKKTTRGCGQYNFEF